MKSTKKENIVPEIVSVDVDGVADCLDSSGHGHIRPSGSYTVLCECGEEATVPIDYQFHECDNCGVKWGVV